MAQTRPITVDEEWETKVDETKNAELTETWLADCKLQAPDGSQQVGRSRHITFVARGVSAGAGGLGSCAIERRGACFQLCSIFPDIHSGRKQVEATSARNVPVGTTVQ